MEAQIKMISAATQAISFRKRNPSAIDEEVLQHVSDFIASERKVDENVKIGMIAAATKASNMARKNPNLSEKELLRRFIEEMPEFIQDLNLSG